MREEYDFSQGVRGKYFERYELIPDLPRETAQRKTLIKLCSERTAMPYTIEVEQEDDGRWIADVVDLPGVMAYGKTRGEAVANVQVLTLRVLADRIEHGESVPEMNSVFAVTP